MNCIVTAWEQHESELRAFILSRLEDAALAEDMLQDVFVKALGEGGRFCELGNARAWLFRVTRNHITDWLRTHKIHEPVPEELPEPEQLVDPVSNLAQCLPTALGHLNSEDREIIELCDLEGLSQAEYAAIKGLSLPGAKSRIQRARKRLKEALNRACHVIFDEHGNVCCFDASC